MHRLFDLQKNNRAKQSRGGYILVLTLVFFGIFFTVASAYLSAITSSARSARHDIASAQALALAEAGVDKAIYELNQNGNYAGETDTSLSTGTFTIAVSSVDGSTKQIIATGAVPNSQNPIATRTITARVGIDNSIISFHYGAQVGAGGMTMANNSQVTGNIYSDGPITGSGTITGDATSASSTGLISGVTVQGTARARSLSNCNVGGDAYYQTISSCPVAGTKYPGSANPATEPMPISDTQIDSWETFASTTGNVINGNYTLSGTQTFGPTLINGNLTINGTLKLSGVVWVKGNIIFGNNSGLTVSSITGNDGAILIADFPGSEAIKGTVSLSNNVEISGNGSAGSYPMILSTNSGSTAITLGNNAESVILYASRGTIMVSNNAEVNQVTAYRLSLSNNATIIYISGLQNSIFSNGPGGSWAFVPGSYAIAQ